MSLTDFALQGRKEIGTITSLLLLALGNFFWRTQEMLETGICEIVLTRHSERQQIKVLKLLNT